MKIIIIKLFNHSHTVHVGYMIHVPRSPLAGGGGGGLNTMCSLMENKSTKKENAAKDSILICGKQDHNYLFHTSNSEKLCYSVFLSLFNFKLFFRRSTGKCKVRIANSFNDKPYAKTLLNNSKSDVLNS